MKENMMVCQSFPEMIREIILYTRSTTPEQGGKYGFVGKIRNYSASQNRPIDVDFIENFNCKN